MRKVKQIFAIVAIVMMMFSTINLQPILAQTNDSRPELDAKKTTVAPIIDGSIDEAMWAVETPLSKQLGDPAALDANFGLLWDQQYLYVGVDIADDQLVFDGSGHWFEQDSISIFLDPSLHQSEPYQANDMQIGLVYQPNSTTPEFYFGGANIPNHEENNENRILRAIETTDKGWSAEVAIPWDMLDFDPNLLNKLGLEIHVTDRNSTEENDAKTAAWSAFERESFWNDTYGFGIANLLDEEVTGTVENILIDENFDHVEDGQLPFGWTTHSSDETVFQVEDGQLTYDGNGAGKSGRALAPVQWDNYTIQADLTFEEVRNNARWASLMFRASANGNNEYNQMAVRQSGKYEIAHRTRSNSWSVPVSGDWDQELALTEPYTLKVRVAGNNVKEFIKPKDSEAFTLLVDETLDLLERGKAGVQADQSKVSFDNFTVTRITATDMAIDIEEELEALTGPIDGNYSVQFSDDVNEAVPTEDVKLYSNDESVIRIENNKIYPITEGTTTIKAVYQNVEVEKEITVTPSTQEVSIVDLQHESGSLFATAGEEIALRDIVLSASFSDLTNGEVTGEQLTWTTDSDQIELTNDTMHVKQKGIYQLTVGQNDVTTNLMLFVKDVDEDAYTLLEENFDGIENGQLPDNWETSAADKIEVSDGELLIDGTGHDTVATPIFLPKYLEKFGNYKIEADFTHIEANNTGRWNSIMYRVQNDSYPYYQMAVRQSATNANGVELAYRTPQDSWNILETSPFEENIASDKMYNYTVIAHDNRVQQYINDQLVIDTDTATHLGSGRIGLQAAGSLTKVDNVRVTLQTEELPEVIRPGDNFVQVTEPDTKIAVAPSVITEVNTSEAYEQLTTNALPATAIFHVNSNLEITDGTNTIATIDQMFEKVNQKIIPAFSVEDEATVHAVVDYLKERSIEDAFILSSNPSLVKEARETYPMLRGIIDFSNQSVQTDEALMDARKTTNSHLSKIAILSQEDATKENITYLQERLMTVWVKENADAENETVNAHKIITTGPNGMIVNNTNTAVESLNLYANNRTLIRKPFITGHRGNPSLAPENTVEGSVLAYDLGATAIENDLYLTKDGHVIVMHDTTIDRTTTGSGNVEDFTLEELRQFNANKQFPEEYPDVKIPTLEEYFEEFKGKDVQLFLEIKSYKPEIVGKIKELIGQYDIEDQSTVITFSGEQLLVMNDVMPNMSGGYLIGRAANNENMHRELRSVLLSVQTFNSTYNPGFGGLDSGLDKLMEVGKHRGLTIWPWTYRDYDVFVEHFLDGTHGLTTDYVQWASELPATMESEEEQYALTVEDTVELNAYVNRYIRDTVNVKPEIVVIDGQDLLEVEENTVTAKASGTAHVLLRYTHEIRESDRYDLYTEPLEITIEQLEIDTAALEALLAEAKTYLDDADQYTTASIEALQEQINHGEALLTSVETDEEVIAAIEALQEAIDHLVEKVDITPLTEAIEAAKAYSNENGAYTEESYQVLVEAIQAAEEAAATIETEEELNAAIEALQTAVEGLEWLINQESLEELIAEAKTYSNENSEYTEESFETLQQSILAAEEALNAFETEEELIEPFTALTAAIEGLVFVISEEDLTQLITEAKTITNENNEYTEATFSALQEAITEAEEILANAESAQEIAEAYHALTFAIDGLEEAVDVTPLEVLIAEAKAYQKDDSYTKTSIEALEAAIVEAEEALSSVETAEELAAAIAALQTAINGLVEKEMHVEISLNTDPKPVYANGTVTVKHTNTTIELPSDLPEGTTLSVETVDVPTDADIKQSGEAYKFNFIYPNDEAYVGDFVLTLGLFKNADEDKAAIHYYSEETNELEKVGGKVTEGTITANVDSFSTYGVFEEIEKHDKVDDPGKETEQGDPPGERPDDKDNGKDKDDNQIPGKDKDHTDNKHKKDKEDNQNKQDKQPSNQKQQDKKSEAGEKLPSTATTYYNYMLAGIILLVIGMTAWLVRRSVRKAE